LDARCCACACIYARVSVVSFGHALLLFNSGRARFARKISHTSQRCVDARRRTHAKAVPIPTKAGGSCRDDMGRHPDFDKAGREEEEVRQLWCATACTHSTSFASACVSQMRTQCGMHSLAMLQRSGPRMRLCVMSARCARCCRGEHAEQACSHGILHMGMFLPMLTRICTCTLGVSLCAQVCPCTSTCRFAFPARRR
jgi:hypothetical protein